MREQALPREALYVADEIFMTGTAAEVTPVPGGSDEGGRRLPAPVTEQLQNASSACSTARPKTSGLADAGQRLMIAGRRHASRVASGEGLPEVPSPGSIPIRESHRMLKDQCAPGAFRSRDNAEVEIRHHHPRT